MSEHKFIDNFKGVHTSTGLPDPAHAQQVINFTRVNHRGWLEFSPGHQSILGLPQVSELHGVSNIQIKDLQTIYVPDHGGQNIRVLLGTYTKTSHGLTVPVTRNSVGVWMRPFWNGSAWVDEWKDLTEFYIVKVDFLVENVMGKIYLKHEVALPSELFANDSLNGFRIIRAGAPADEHFNFLPILDSVVDGGNYYLQWAMYNSYLEGNIASDDTLYLVRNFASALVPSLLGSHHILNVLDELRISTGIGDSDIVMFAGFREKTFGFSVAGFSSIDRLVMSEAQDERLDGATVHEHVQVDGTDPLSAGTYRVRHTLRLDDGQEFALRNHQDSGRWLSHVRHKAFVSPDFLPTGDNNIVAALSNGRFVLASGADGGTEMQVRLMESDFSEVWTRGVGGAGDGSPVFVGSTSTHIFVIQGVKLYRLPMDGVSSIDAETIAASATAGALDDDYLYVSMSNGDVSRYTHSLVLDDTVTPTDVCRSIVPTDSFVYFGVDGGLVERVVHSTFETLQTVSLDQTYPVVTGCIGGDGDYYFGQSQAGDTRISRISSSSFILDDTFVLTGDFDEIRSLIPQGNSFYFLSGQHIVRWSAADGVITKNVTNLDDRIPHSAALAGAGVVVAGSEGESPDAWSAIREFSMIDDVFSGGSELLCRVMVSPSMLPVRSKTIRTYLQKNDGAWLLVKETDLYSGSWSWLWLHTYKHPVMVSESFRITETQASGTQERADILLGRVPTERGVIRYTWASATSRQSFACGVLRSGIPQKNTAAVSCQSGSGIPQFDVFPNDPAFELKLEYNDGDEIVAISAIGERVLVLKRRTVALLSANSIGQYDVDFVEHGRGIVAPRTLVIEGDRAHWLDVNGFVTFSSRGLELTGFPVWYDVRQLSTGFKQAAFAVLDAERNQYRAQLFGRDWILDFMDGEWTQEILSSVPTAYAIDRVDGKPVILFGSGANAGLHKYADDVLRGSSPQQGVFRTSEWVLDESRALDSHVKAFYIEYESDVVVRFGLYVNGETVARKEVDLPAGQKGEILRAPLSVRAKTVSLRVEATAAVSGKKIKIKRMGVYFDRIPGGFVRSWQ